MNRVGIELGIYRPEESQGKVAFQNEYLFADAHKETPDKYIECPMADPERQEYTPYYGEPEWQFHIRLVPDKKNLQLAASILSEVLEKYNLPYKLLRPATDKPSLGYDPVQDYTLAFTETPHPDLDRINRHRLGQEFCVRLAYSNTHNKFQHSPAEYKEIMLQCIKALQDNAVQFGSLIAPIGALNIPTDRGIPPLMSYSLTRPVATPDTRHNILPSSEHNPLGFIDPLEDIRITTEDLIRHGIDVDALKDDCRKRVARQERHFDDAVASLAQDLQHIFEHRKVRSFIRPEAADVPLVPEREHSPFLKKDESNKMSELRKNEYQHFIEAEKRKTVEDFEKSSFAMAFLKKHLPQPAKNQPGLNTNLHTLVSNNLKAMQIIYLRLVHLEHEQKCLNNTLIFLEGKLPDVINSLQRRVRCWQPNNVPIREAFKRTFEEMDKLPNTEENLKSRMEIIHFFESALPAEHREKNPLTKYSLSSEEFEFDEDRKAALSAKLKNLAQKLDGKGPTWGKVLGAVLIVSGILLGGLCLLTLIPSLGLSALPGVTLSTGMILGGASFFGATAVGGGVTCYLSRDTGASKAVYDLACAI